MAEQEKQSSIIRTGIITMVVVFAAMGVYGFITHWINSTQFHAVNQRSVKTQEAPGYTALPESSDFKIVQSDYGVSGYVTPEQIVTETDVSTRDIAKKAVNPVPLTVESIENGKQLFFYYCSRCHGVLGNGQGLMGSIPSLRREDQQQSDDLATYLSGYLGYKPNVKLGYVQDESIGEIYYTITNGGEAIMPPYRDALSPKDRWDVINYIKNGLNQEIGNQLSAESTAVTFYGLR